MKPHRNRPVVITDAERSQEDQLRTREIRYVLMMSIRVVSVITAVVLFTLQPPGLWLWLSLCAVGMIIVPWAAVVLANDRLPKEQHRWRRFRPGGRRALSAGSAGPADQPGIAAAGPSAPPAGDTGQAGGAGPVIDVDPPAARPG